MWQYFNRNWKQKERAKQQRQTEKWMKCKQSTECSLISLSSLSSCSFYVYALHCFSSWSVQNCCFVENLSQVWNEWSNTFDFIHLASILNSNQQWTLLEGGFPFFSSLVYSIQSSTNIVDMNSYISICWQRLLCFMRPFIQVQFFVDFSLAPSFTRRHHRMNVIKYNAKQ